MSLLFLGGVGLIFLFIYRRFFYYLLFLTYGSLVAYGLSSSSVIDHRSCFEDESNCV